MKYLGYILTLEGISVDSEKTTAISHRREQRNVNELISFTQTCSWYRRFIENYASIARPITDRTKKTAVWKAEEPQQNPFQMMKDNTILIFNTLRRKRIQLQICFHVHFVLRNCMRRRTRVYVIFMWICHVKIWSTSEKISSRMIILNR